MANNTLNLIYSTDKVGFFSKLNSIKTILDVYKKTPQLGRFNGEHEKEISRGNSYAFFSELENTAISVKSFRNSLTLRHITDLGFQNKILSLILQNEAGLHFAIGQVINSLLLEQFLFVMDPDYKTFLEDDRSDSVNLVFRARWGEISHESRIPAFDVCVKINISPEQVSITEFNLEKISDSSYTNEVYKFLEANQQNIFMKIITMIRHKFGFNSELRLEEKQNGDADWVSKLSPA